jgi:ORF6N domain
MPSKKLTLPNEAIDNLIREVRGQKIILDFDLAALYGVTTKAFNQAVKRNLARFPVDFMFRLTGEEADQLSRSQIVTGSSAATRMRSQNVTASKRNVRYLPYAFTEHGALQAANILNSARAVQMSVFVIRAFVKMRETLLGTRKLAKKLAALEKQLTGRLDSHAAAIFHVLQELADS